MAHILTTRQAINLFWVSQFAREHGGLLPQPKELADLSSENPAKATRIWVELRQLGFFTNNRKVATFDTKAAAIYPAEAAIISVTLDIFTDYGLSVATDTPTIEFIARLRYPQSNAWDIARLLHSAVQMGYLYKKGGLYDCTPKVVEHREYLKLLLASV